MEAEQLAIGADEGVLGATLRIFLLAKEALLPQLCHF